MDPKGYRIFYCGRMMPTTHDVGEWRGPSYDGEFPSLGWAIIDQLEGELLVPAGDRKGKPLKLTNRQVETLVRLYKLVQENGVWRRQYTKVAIHESKGTGKSPLAAMIVIAELLLETVFSHFDERGEPVGVVNRSALANIGANSEEQGKRTTWVPLREMMNKSVWATDGTLVVNGRGTVGETKIEVSGDQRQAMYVAGSAYSIEGVPATVAVLEESQYCFESNGGIKFASVMEDNVAKTDGLFVEVSNMPEIDRGSYAELTYLEAERQRAEAEADPSFIPDLLYIAYGTTPPEDDEDFDPRDPDNKEIVMAAIEEAYGPALKENGGWISKRRIYSHIKKMKPLEAMRKFLNWRVKNDGFLIGGEQWDRLEDTDRVIPDGSAIVLSFDGSKSRDSTALLRWGFGTDDDGDWLHCEVVRIWARPPGERPGEWRVPRGEVRRAVEDEYEKHRVRLFVGDYAAGWESTMDDWAADYGEQGIGKTLERGGPVMAVYTANAVKFWAAMVNSFEADVTDLERTPFTHDGDETLRRHVLAMLKDQKMGRDTVTKAGDSILQQIDAGVAAILGYGGYRWLQQQGGGKGNGQSIDWAARMRGEESAPAPSNAGTASSLQEQINERMRRN